jgi:hypothetical protein
MEANARELLAVHIGSKSVVLMKDPPTPRTEMSGALPDNFDTMFWARCLINGKIKRTARNAKEIRKFVGTIIDELDEDQSQRLAVILGYLLKVGDVVGGPYVSLERAAEIFRVDREVARPKLAGGRLVFFAEVSDPYDLLGVLNEYEYDLGTTKLRHVRTIQPDPVWETPDGVHE